MTSALDVTCPYCGAAPGNFCKTVNGTTRPAHAARKESTMAAPEKHTVVITRAQLYPEVAYAGPAWRWTYDYTIDGGPVCQYGPGLTSLRRMLREKFGARNVDIVETWKQRPGTPAV
jgi:hypothetical protein